MGASMAAAVSSVNRSRRVGMVAYLLAHSPSAVFADGILSSSIDFARLAHDLEMTEEQAKQELAVVLDDAANLGETVQTNLYYY